MLGLIRDIDLTIAAMDNMRKNFDIVPREEAIIKAGYVPFGWSGLWKTKAEYSGVLGEYYSVAVFVEYSLSIKHALSR